MGVKRSEMRLLTAYVEARMELMQSRNELLKRNAIGISLKSQEAEIEISLNEQRYNELDKLFDILGGYSD